MGKSNELGPEEPQFREQAKLPFSRRLRYWWWGGAEVELGEPPWRITVYPPGPGAKLAEFASYFRDQWKEFLLAVIVTVVGGLVLAMASFD